MNRLIELLDGNERLSNEDLAVMLGMTEEEVAKEIDKLEREGIIRGYKTIINWDKVEVEHVTAFIEIKVQPKLGLGFDEIATRITQLEEVESVYLMSGGFDLGVMIRGKNFQEIAMFVARRLSPLDSVVSTATHFVLKKYKEASVEVEPGNGDDRRKLSL